MNSNIITATEMRDSLLARLNQLKDKKLKNIVISTGAGISAESGIHTYRDLEGLWTKFDPMEVSHIRGWKNNPQKVIDFKNMLRKQFAEGNYKPNAAHYALTRLQSEWKQGEVTIITQNIDGLHRVAGSSCLEIHGTGMDKICEHCKFISPFDADIILSDSCEKCGECASTRPNIVMFGEYPHHLDIVEKKLDECDMFVVIGSSLEVMPGSLFGVSAAEHGAETYFINKEIPPHADLTPYKHQIFGAATVEVPKFVDWVLSQQ